MALTDKFNVSWLAGALIMAWGQGARARLFYTYPGFGSLNHQTKPPATAAPIKYNYVCLDWEEAVGSISGGSLAGDRADMRAGACNGQTTDHWCTIYLMLAIALSKQSNQL